jgi:hypothetical protein
MATSSVAAEFFVRTTMAKPSPTNVTDANHKDLRKFGCGKKNVFRLIGNDFDDLASVQLDDPAHFATWSPPDPPIVIVHSSEFEIHAQCSCSGFTIAGFFLRLLWPLLWRFGLVKWPQYGIGGLTVTVTNQPGNSGQLTYPNGSITYGS